MGVPKHFSRGEGQVPRIASLVDAHVLVYILFRYLFYFLLTMVHEIGIIINLIIQISNRQCSHI